MVYVAVILSEKHSHYEGVSNKLKTFIFIYFAKAFDSVTHRVLCTRLYICGIGSVIAEWIEIFLLKDHILSILEMSMLLYVAACSGVLHESVIGSPFQC